MLEHLLGGGSSVVVESTFKPREQRKDEILGMVDKHDARGFEVYLWADKETLVERFKARSGSNERHLGHVDSDNLEEFVEVLENQPHESLGLGGELIKIDTSEMGDDLIDEWVGGVVKRMGELG